MTQENIVTLSCILAELAGLLRTPRGDELNGKAQMILLIEHGRIEAEKHNAESLIEFAKLFEVKS